MTTSTPEQPSSSERFPTFWHWLCGGPLVTGKPGWRKLAEPSWLWAHGVLGLLAALAFNSVPLSALGPYLLGGSVFLALGIVLAGQTLDSLAATPRRLGKFFAQHPDGALNYIFTFQLALLVGLVTVLYWMLMPFWPLGGAPVLKVLGFALFSVTVREFWQMNLGRAYLLNLALAPESPSPEETQSPTAD